MVKDKVVLGLIGCGEFARCMHVPILMKSNKYEIRGVADIFQKSADTMKELTGAAYAVTDVDELLKDEEIDAVLITTRHDSHAELSIKAARAGKHILCEKPMGLSLEECRQVVEAVRAAGVKYTVGYNRGLAPMITMARDMLQNEKGKKMIYHRIQAPFPEDSWTHDPKVGGGRFVGEGCHIFDLLCELIDARPVSVYAAGGIFLDSTKVHIPDSAVVVITFEDGSVGTTLINSAGCPDFPKEATEIYCDNKAIFINDFNHMESYGFQGHKKITMDFDSTDKGHAIELEMFANAILYDKEVPNSLQKAVRAAAISYLVNESIEKKTVLEIKQEDFAND